MSDRNTGAWVFAVMAMVAVVAAFIVGTATVGEDFAIPAMIVGAIVLAVGLRSPLAHALVEHLRSGGQTVPDDATLAELDELRARMVELEERVDFAERLLAGTQAPERIAAPPAREQR